MNYPWRIDYTLDEEFHYGGGTDSRCFLLLSKTLRRVMYMYSSLCTVAYCHAIRDRNRSETFLSDRNPARTPDLSLIAHSFRRYRRSQ